MITLNQPGLKSFIAYVLSFIFLTLFIYLGIPFFFDYESNKSILKKKIHNNFGLHLNFTSKVKYNFFPSPRLNLQNVEILSFSKTSNKIGSANKVILKVPFKKLISLDKLDFDSVDIVNANINIDTSEINIFKKYLNNMRHERPIQLKKSKVNLLNKEKLLFSIDLKKSNILNKDLYNKVNLKGKIFNTKIKINYNKKIFGKNSTAYTTLGFPEMGLSVKLNTNIDKKNNGNHYGEVNFFFPNNNLYFDYLLNNNVLSISSSTLINNYFKGQLSGDLIFFPFSIFDLKLDINLLKFENILNSKFLKNRKFLNELVPFNKKINGKINITFDKIVSSSNIINSGTADLEFRNGVLMLRKLKLDMNKIGNIIFIGKILQLKKKKLFIFETKINLHDSKNFYSRFLIPEKKRTELKPINLFGKIDFESQKINLDGVYYNQELDPQAVLALEEKINEIFLQNSLNNILKYSNLRKIIHSFF